ncbi:MAG: hydroxylase [Chloroflexi bacterium]|nr:MAG: hydroxylase [Chloroflexota bacterium]
MRTVERVRRVDGARLLEEVRQLAPLISNHCDAAERERRVAKAVIDELVSAGVFHMFVPRVFGGGEVDVATGVRILEELSKADGSTGWIAMIGATTGMISAYLPEHVASEIYRPGTITGGVVAPRGIAARENDGYRVNGTWSFASGCEHSDWLACACVVEGSDPLDVRMMILSAKDIQIIDTWYVSGLRGTGSQDIAVKDAYVPNGCSFSLTGRPVHTTLLYGFSLMGLLAVSVGAVALGIGRAALHEIGELASAKTPTGRRRALADWNVAQMAIAEGEAALRSGRAFLFEAIAAMWSTLERGEEPAIEDRTLVRLAASQAVQCSVRAVDIAYNLGGGSSLYESSRLQRQFRDIHALTQHIMVGPSSFEAAGRALLGREVPPGFL